MRLCALFAIFICSSSFAQEASLVRDMDQHVVQDTSSYPRPLGMLGGSFLFAASQGAVGTELFKLVGTTAVLVRDINPGPDDSAPGRPIVVGGIAYFTAKDSLGRELWRTDGTRSGTYRVADLAPGPADAFYDADTMSWSAVIGTTFYFVVNGVLWKSDGTVAGTVEALPAGSNVGSVGTVVAVSAKLYFVADDTTTPASDSLLYKFDTTTPLVPAVKLSRMGGGSVINVSNLVRAGSRVVFSGTDSSYDYEPCYTNGSDQMVCFDLDTEASTGSAPQGFTALPDGTVYFAARSLYGQAWSFRRLDAGATTVTGLGTTVIWGNGAVMAYTVGPSSHSFYVLNDTINGRRLYYVTNSTTSFTQITGVYPKAYPFQLSSDNSTIYFVGTDSDGISNPRVWGAGVSGFALVPSIAAPENLFGAAGVFSCATSGSNGTELYFRSYPTDAVVDVAPPYLQTPDAITEIVVSGDVAYLSAVDGPNAHLWISDGTPLGTNPHPGGTYDASTLTDPASLTAWQGGVAFVSGSSVYWAGPSALERVYQGSAGNVTLNVAQGALLIGEYGSGGPVTYRRHTSPTDAGQSLGAYGGSNPWGDPSSEVTCGATLCYLSVTGWGPNFTRLYVFDGSAISGPAVDSSASSNPYRGVVFGNRFLYRGDDGEPWIADGMGNTRVKDVNPVTGSSPSKMTVAGGRVFFTADDGDHGTELWITDGTSAGTRLVADASPGSPSSVQDSFIALGDLLFFVSTTASAGGELWRSDGTTVEMVVDLAPGAEASAPTGLLPLPDLGLLMFAGYTPANGVELWQTDGASTVRVSDIVQNEGSSSPRLLTPMADRLLFVATDGQAGFALWQRAHSPDVSVAFESPPSSGFVLADAEYALRVTNNGPSTAAAVALSLTAATGVVAAAAATGCTANGATLGCAFGDLPSGGSVVVSYTLKVAADANVAQQAVVATSSLDRDDRNNAATVSTTFARSSDREIAFVEDPPKTVGLNAEVILHLRAKNLGATPDTNVKVTGPAVSSAMQLASSDSRCSAQTGAFVCELGALGVGIETDFYFRVAAPSEQLVDVQFVVSGDNPDPAPSNDKVSLKMQFANLEDAPAALDTSSVANEKQGCSCGQEGEPDGAWLLVLAAFFVLRRWRVSKPADRVTGLEQE